jgi:hypothetical protein
MEVSGQFHTLATLPLGKSMWYPLDRRLGGNRASLDILTKRKNPHPYQESNPSQFYLISFTKHLKKLNPRHAVGNNSH